MEFSTDMLSCQPGRRCGAHNSHRVKERHSIGKIKVKAAPTRVEYQQTIKFSPLKHFNESARNLLLSARSQSPEVAVSSLHMVLHGPTCYRCCCRILSNDAPLRRRTSPSRACGHVAHGQAPPVNTTMGFKERLL